MRFSSLPALAALILAVAGRLKDALRAVDIARRLRPTYAIDDFLSSFRVVGSEEPAHKAAARGIGDQVNEPKNTSIAGTYALTCVQKS